MRSRVDPALLSALAVGLVVRLARIARAPLIHPDGPAYLALASDLLHGDVRRVLESYYSPAYPGLVAIAIAAGGAPEVAGRLAAAGAGLAALPLLHTLTRRLLGARAAGVAVLTAALHPALVKAAADVLPETLAGAFLLAWLVVLVRAQGTVGLAAAGALAGAAYLARPEGVLLVPLGVAWAVRRQHRAALVAYVVAALLVMSPALLALHARSGLWQLSPREARLAATAAVGAEPTLVATLVHHPVALLARTLVGGATQLVYDAKVLGVLLAVPFVFGPAPPPRTTRPAPPAARARASGSRARAGCHPTGGRRPTRVRSHARVAARSSCSSSPAPDGWIGRRRRSIVRRNAERSARRDRPARRVHVARLSGTRPAARRPARAGGRDVRRRHARAAGLRPREPAAPHARPPRARARRAHHRASARAQRGSGRRTDPVRPRGIRRALGRAQGHAALAADGGERRLEPRAPGSRRRGDARLAREPGAPRKPQWALRPHRDRRGPEPFRRGVLHTVLRRTVSGEEKRWQRARCWPHASRRSRISRRSSG